MGAGTGLGMSMVYGLMKSHRGMVDVTSALGVGTVVTLGFPIVPGPHVEELPEEAPMPPKAPRGHEGILVVEDDDAIREATRRALVSHGYQVWTAEDGSVGLAMYRRHASEIALIVSDLVMPNLGGHDMADALRNEGVTVPILFTSGYSSDWLFGDGDTPAHVLFMPKPWTLADLHRRVRAALDGADE
jgi:two-component system, cell cycle sensor histidine kinase and response regulator CckA